VLSAPQCGAVNFFDYCGTAIQKTITSVASILCKPTHSVNRSYILVAVGHQDSTIIMKVVELLLLIVLVDGR